MLMTVKKIGTDKTNSLLRYYYLHNSKQDHNGDDDEANSSKVRVC